MKGINPNFSDNKINSSKTWKKWGVFSLAVIVCAVLFIVWALWLSPEAKQFHADQKNYELAMNAISTYETAMKNDTYGGKTPQETLDLFIGALEKEDLDLASKYFILEESGEQNKEWNSSLYEAKKKNETDILIKYLLVAEPNLEDVISDSDYKFISLDENKDIVLYIDLEFNKYSGVWKIESL